MSKYTTEVRFICETYAGLTESTGYDDENKIIEQSREKVFSFDFPIFDEAYRSVLETKILKHYYTREIGMETVGLWKHFLDMRMNEIMPYYNQLYKSELLEFNPFYDNDYYTKRDDTFDHDQKTTDNSLRTDNLKEDTHNLRVRTDNLKETVDEDATRTDDLTNTTDTNSTRTDNLAHTDHTTDTKSSWDRYSDTPQGALTNVKNNEYLTNARGIDETEQIDNNGTNTGTQATVGHGTSKDTGTQKNDVDRTIDNTGTQTIEDTGSKTNTGTQNIDGNGTNVYKNTDDYLEHVAGKRGTDSYSNMLIEYRKTFLNIDMMIIDNLSDLFFNLW